MAPTTEASPRAYSLLLGAVVVIPAILVAVFAWWNWERVKTEAAAQMDQRVDMLQENALRLLQTVDVQLDRIDDRVAGMSWPEIIARKDDLRDKLTAIAAGVGEVETAVLLDPDGNLQLTTRRTADGSAPPSLNLRDSDFFQTAKKGPEMAFDGPFRGRVANDVFIVIARRLSSPDGSFRGVAALVVSPNRIAQYWSSLIERADSVNLIRDDGTVLVRLPEPVSEQRQRISDLALSMRRRADRGQFDQPASVFDGVARRVAYRKLPSYPLYVGYAVDRENFVWAWLPTVIAFAAFAGLASLALFLIARAVVHSAVALRESEGRYRALYDYTPVPMHALDIAGRIVAVSERWLDLLGYSRAEAIGRPIAEFRTAERARDFDRTWQQVVEAGGVRDLEGQYVRKSGEVIDVLISSRAERDAVGHFRRMAVVVIDVTEKKRMEGTLRQVQKMEAVGQLTGGIAHDFNNLLTVIGGNLDMLRMHLESGEPELRRLLEGALRGATRAATLTQRLLAFSRRQPLDPKPINPNRLVSGLSEMLGRTLGESIAIETVLAGGLWRVEADENQLESTVLNLAVNARDAMPNGGKLTIETANTFLDESYATTNHDVMPGQYVMIAVSDSGSGMTEEVMARAFEPFFTTKQVGQGTGLGLSQTYGFMKQSGGHVKIYSEPGQGTTVKLYLPRLAGADVHEGPGDVQQAAADVSGATILVVEDDNDVRAYATEALRLVGYRVLSAADGDAALRIIAETPDIDLLFTDVGLPAPHNGRELADRVRELRPAIKVLFTTGYARNAIVHHGRLDAGVALILKPYTHADVAAKIRDVLGNDPAGNGLSRGGRLAAAPVKSSP